MLLEVNRPKHLIVGRPPSDLADQAVWRQLSQFKILILATPEERELWEKATETNDNVYVLEYDADLAYELSSNIGRALEFLDAEPHNSIYVSFRGRDELQEAINTRIGTIQVGGSIGEVMPDIFLREFPGDLAAVQNAAGVMRLGFFAEVIAVVADGVPPCPGGQVISQRNFFRQQIHIPRRDELTGIDLVLLGRYFPSGDVRHSKHQLSRRLLKAKQLDPKSKR